VWSGVVGDEIAAHAVVTGLEENELVVTVDHPTWGTELRLLSSTILAEVEKQVEMPVGVRIKVRVRPR
jgi:predicted nucleic acid-binding Zn ribbon protein